MSIESQLRDALTARAEQVVADGEEGYERVTGAISAHRRRRRGLAAGPLAVACAVAVAVPLLGHGRDRTAPPARHHQTVAPVPTDPALWRSMRVWPTRGELAGDTAFVEEVTRRVAPEGHALYAADLTRNRVVVFWVPSDDRSMPDGALRVASGPRGAAADELATQHEQPATSADAVVFREGADGGGRLVVLTRPTEREARFSDGVEVGPDGTVSRTWQQLRLTDGLGSAQPVSSLALNRVQVAGYDGGVTLTAGMVSTGRPLPEGAGICMDCAGDVFRQKAEQGVRESVAQRLGLAVDLVVTTTRYSGPLDAVVARASGLTDATSPGARHTLYIGDTTLPGGGVLRTVLLSSMFATGGSVVEIASDVPIAAATAAQRPVLVGGLRRPGGGVVTEVFAPGAAAVRLVSTAPTLWPHSAKVRVAKDRARIELDDAEFRQHYRVEPYDASGRSLGTFPIELPNAADPFDVQPGG